MTKVIALKPHSPDGIHRYKTGDRYSISDASARLLIATKRVRVDDRQEDPPKDRKKYERRDMRPED